MPEGYNRLSEAQKTIFGGIYGMCLFVFLLIGELGTCPKTFVRRRGVEHCEKIHFPQGGMLIFTYKGQILTKKKAYKKMLNSKSGR
jgi:hypothetical protein